MGDTATSPPFPRGAPRPTSPFMSPNGVIRLHGVTFSQTPTGLKQDPAEDAAYFSGGNARSGDAGGVGQGRGGGRGRGREGPRLGRPHPEENAAPTGGGRLQEPVPPSNRTERSGHAWAAEQVESPPLCLGPPFPPPEPQPRGPAGCKAGQALPLGSPAAATARHGSRTADFNARWTRKS